MSYLGIDLGTSGLRVLLINDQGEAIKSAVASYVVYHNSDGWSEQDPMHRIDALEKTIKENSTSCSEFKNIREEWCRLNDVVIARGAGDNAAPACGISTLDINI